ncbi:MAG: hypothetical protein A2170_01315 [Deltaproteobacteria bacterium RBG_13_53_10]|nr:MAG: hypothetical protein A2170_01315 [Deltaproteobacteria bacterium RBG_13_53_10]
MKKARLVIALVFVGFISSWQGAFAATHQDITGVWQSQAETTFGVCYGETSLMPNGQYSKTLRCGEMFTREVGTYVVEFGTYTFAEGFEEYEGYLRFKLGNYEPKIYKGGQMILPRDQTVFFRFDAPDRMICYDRITGGRWEATRKLW